MLWEWCKVSKCRVVLADFTLTLLVPFLCVLHVRVPLSLPLCFIAASSSFQMSLKCSLLWMLPLKWLSGCCNFYSIHYSSYHTVLWLLPFLISAYLWTLSFPRVPIWVPISVPNGKCVLWINEKWKRDEQISAFHHSHTLSHIKHHPKLKVYNLRTGRGK